MVYYMMHKENAFNNEGMKELKNERMKKRIRIMRTKLIIIALLSAITISASAQQYSPASVTDPAIQSQQIMSGSAYNGTVYEPFSNSVPSEQSAVGSSYTPTSRPRRSKENPGEPGITDDNASPIGDAVLPLMLFAVAFGGVIAFRRRREA